MLYLIAVFKIIPGGQADSTQQRQNEGDGELRRMEGRSERSRGVMIT